VFVDCAPACWVRLVTVGLLLAVPMTAVAQQVTGAPGSPDATRTIDGRYLPNPPPQFGGGYLNMSVSQSGPAAD
jgi:hypothetical protein